jgi:hypothetical protein
MARPRKLNPSILEAALAGLEAQREHVVEQIALVRRMLGQGARPGVATTTEESTARAKRRRMSAAGRKRIAEAARKRWAEYKKNKKRET